MHTVSTKVLLRLRAEILWVITDAMNCGCPENAPCQCDAQVVLRTVLGKVQRLIDGAIPA